MKESIVANARSIKKPTSLKKGSRLAICVEQEVKDTTTTTLKNTENTAGKIERTILKKYQERQREYMKEYKTRTHYCPLCDVEVQLKSKARHEKTAWHQGNLRRSENPEEKLPEPDEIKIIDGKKHFRCLTCRASFLPYQWEKHIMEKHRET